MEFRDRVEVKKGDLGESIVDFFLVRNGYIPYVPQCDGAHPFDRLCASSDKKTIFIADVKAKARRKYYPDTGINIKHYDEYNHMNAKYGVDVYLFFVDEETETVYGNLLKVLGRERQIEHKGKILIYPLRQKNIIYFPLESMRTISSLTAEQIKELKKVTTKKKGYIMNQAT